MPSSRKIRDFTGYRYIVLYRRHLLNYWFDASCKQDQIFVSLYLLTTEGEKKTTKTCSRSSFCIHQLRRSARTSHDVTFDPRPMVARSLLSRAFYTERGTCYHHLDSIERFRRRDILMSLVPSHRSRRKIRNARVFFVLLEESKRERSVRHSPFEGQAF